MPQESTSVGWVLIGIGLASAALGLMWLLAPSIPCFGRLPGDIRIETDDSRFYFPLTTCVLLSLALSAIVWLVRYFRG
jgi:hypothetical protein